MFSVHNILARQFPKGTFGRSVAVLAGGTAIGQLFAVLASPMLTRFYGPSNFGILAVYTSMISIVGSFSALSYHQAIPLPEDDETAANILGIAFLAEFIVVGALATLLAFAGTRIANSLDAPGLVPYLWMIPFGVLGLASYEILMQWAVRLKAFPTMAKTSIARGVAQSGTQLGFGFAEAGSAGLLIGQLLGQWTGSFSLLKKAMQSSGNAIRGINLSSMRAMAIRYRRFPQFTAPSVLINSISLDAPALLLSFFFGGTTTGLYALGQRVLMMPFSLIGKSVSQVFLSRAPEANRQGTLAEETLNIFHRLLHIALPLVFLLAVVAPELFSVVFGREWREAGVYARWLSPWLLFVFITAPLGQLVTVLERQSVGFIFQLLLLIGRITALVVGGILGNPKIAIGLFASVSGISWMLYLAWLFAISGNRLSSLNKIFFREVIAIALPIITLLVLRQIFSNDYFSLIFSIFLGIYFLNRILHKHKPK